MGNLADHQRMGGEGVHIGDCYVWAEIYYLNSTTDYREYLPQDGADGPRSISHDNWIPLEFSERAPGKRRPTLVELDRVSVCSPDLLASLLRCLRRLRKSGVFSLV